MGPNINYTRRSAHLNHGVAKHRLEERREKQQLAQHRMQEAVRRAIRSTAGLNNLEPTQTYSTATNGRKWAFSHARGEGGRRMGAAVAHRSALTTSAYTVLPPEKLEKKKHQLLATADWSSLSRSNSPASLSRSQTIIQDEIRPDASQVKVEPHDCIRQSVPSRHLHLHPVPKLEPVPEEKMEVKQEDALQHDTSSVDINMPSSPPHQNMTLSSSIQSNYSSSLSSLPGSIQYSKPEEKDVKPSSDVLSAILSTQDSFATQCLGTEVSVEPEIQEEKPFVPFQTSEVAPEEVLQRIGPPLAYFTRIRDLQTAPLVCSFLLPCMMGDDNPPFGYDGVLRSHDYLGMAFAGPDMRL